MNTSLSHPPTRQIGRPKAHGPAGAPVPPPRRQPVQFRRAVGAHGISASVLVCCFAAFFGLSQAASAASYLITNAPGWNLIANQLDGANGNNIRVVLGSSVPFGSTIRKFDLATRSFGTVELLTAAGGWQPGTTILNPGDGLYFSNALSSDVILTLSGNPHVPTLPINIGPSLGLVARQTNAPATINEILGYAPPNFTAVYRFNQGAGHDANILAPPHYSIHAFKAGAWTLPLGAPAMRVGEAVWVTTNGSLPTITSQAKDQLICPGGTASFSVRALGTPPLTYQWTLNGNAVLGATDSTLNVVNAGPGQAGTYAVTVTNPFGSITSNPVTLSFPPPPTAVGPSNTVVCPRASVVLQTAPIGAAPFTFIWFKGGVLLPNQTSSSLQIAAATTSNEGIYCVVVTDSCGLTVTNCATLRVGDFAPPVLTCPQDLVAQCRGAEGTVVTYNVGILDDCDPAPSLVCTPASGSIFPMGITKVTCVGKDSAGNQSTCSFNVTVTDTQAPALQCPKEIIVAATGPNGARVPYTVLALDNCDKTPQLDCKPPSGSVFPIGITRVDCIAVDASDNRATCSFNVVVLPANCCPDRAWNRLDQAGPSARDAHVMAYDSTRGRVVLFGGTGAGGLLGDTWEWDGTGWFLMASNGPAPRAFSAMAYDSRIGMTILFGGNGPNGQLGDTWTWDGNGWTQIQVPGPSARLGHAMAYDSGRARTVLYGGLTASAGGSTELADTWEFDGQQWIPAPANTANPGPRRSHAMAYDSAQDQLLLFGGFGQGNVFGDTWRWDGVRWIQLSAVGPKPRAFHAMAYNNNCDRVVLHGGAASAAEIFDDTWEWDGAAWSLTAVKTPIARLAHAMAHHSGRGQTLLFGGSRGAEGLLADSWVYGPDPAPPQVTTLYAPCGDNKICLALSKSALLESARNPGNYQILCGGAAVGVSQIVVSEDGRIICLVLDQPLALGTVGCVLVVSGLEDNCGHRMPITQIGIQCTPDPCPHGSGGNEFWLTFPGNYAPDATNPPSPQLFISGNAGTLGVVSMPHLIPPFFAPFSIPASGEITIALPRTADLENANDVVGTNGVHVFTSQPVTIHGYNHLAYTSDAYLGLPTKALGQAYLVLSYQNVFNGVPELSGVQFAVVAAQNNTTVVIVPSASVGGHPAGVPYNLTLQRGQTYQLRDTNAVPADLSGTIVVASQPVGVFGSHQCANIPNTNVFFCDYIVEQMLPIEQWGNNFITISLQTRLNGDTFRFMAVLNGTTVRIDGVPIPILLNRGQFFETQLTASHQITSDKPILVAQYADSSDYDFVVNSDPFMVLVPPVSLYGSSYQIEVPPASDFSDNYVNLSTAAAGVGQVQVDGVAVPAAQFSPVGASGYFGARVSVTSGPHTLSSASATPFGAIVYGWSTFESYGYPAGTCSALRGQPPRFTCPPSNLVAEVRQNCQAPVPDLSAQIGNANEAVFIDQQPPPGTLLGPGTYPITVAIFDAFGNRQTCSSVLTIPPSPGPGLQCPGDLRVRCAKPSGTQVNYAVGLCNSNFVVVCDPPSGSLFPVGQTTVKCSALANGKVVEQCLFTVTVFCTEVKLTTSGNSITVSWAGGGTLQKAATVNGPWVSLPDAKSPYEISRSGQQGFFRISE